MEGLFEKAKRLENFYNRFWQFVSGPPHRANILHPMFLSKYYVKKALKPYFKFVKGTVLDIGCGIQPYRKDICEAGKVKNYWGFDYFHTVSKDKIHVPEVNCTALELPVRSNSIDTVICTGVLEHIFEHSDVIKEVNRILKKNGNIIAFVPFMYPLHGNPFDYFRFSYFGVKSLFEENGFKHIEIKRDSGAIATLSSIFLHYLNYRIFVNPDSEKVKIFLGGIKVMVTPLLLAINAVLNLFCLLIKKIDNDKTINSNFIIYAIKKE